ncbi:hypothetical protein EXIGLDRAFT_727633 [Exidia glandulosa HHB12029]|uniref:Uncharacterized protein n=1 Tax=Exidia glandulosa HHB12029 TaxID=1314781 RepID=A0A165LZH3_EXIGL|nr:hypothetical protein EXIGLDRAFT_727633 [Exidia glandulosa HHB12029]
MADPSQGDAMLLQHIAADEGILAIIEGQVTQARSAVQKAERDLAIARALLDDSLAKRLAFQQSMKRKRAVLTVIPSFPTELLCAVFERVVEMERTDILATSVLYRKRSQEARSTPFAIPLPEPYRRFPRPGVLALAAVCQRWRDAALAHPPLWSLVTLWCRSRSIGSHPSLAHLHRCLERSRGVPLNVLHFDSCGSSCTDCTAPSYAQAVQNIYMRCGELSIEFSPLIYVPRNHPLHFPTPQLRRCTVYESGNRTPPTSLDNLNNHLPASVDWLPQAHRLESFSAHPCATRSTNFAIQTCAQLTTLRLEDQIVSTRQLAMFGTYWPKLQHLAIRACEFQGPSSVPAVLPFLVALHLGQKAMPVLSFLHREHVPALEYLAMPCTVQAITTFATFLEAQPYTSLNELHLCGADWQTAPMNTLPWPSGENLTAYMQFLPNVRILRYSEIQIGSDLLTAWARGGVSHSPDDVLNTIVLRGCFLDGDTASHVMRSLARDENFLWSDALVIVKRDPSRDASWYEMIADSNLTSFSFWTRPDSYLIESQYRKL